MHRWYRGGDSHYHRGRGYIVCLCVMLVCYARVSNIPMPVCVEGTVV